MQEPDFSVRAAPAGPVGRALDRVSRLFAVCSGLMLVAMALMSVYSIIGRSVLGKPVLGDYELVQMMSAVAVAMALPYCQMANGHIIVDFFTVRNSSLANDFLDLLAALLLAVFSFVISWRIGIATLEFMKNRDASMLLNLPTWWGYAPMVPSFFLLGCAALYTASGHARKLRD